MKHRLNKARFLLAVLPALTFLTALYFLPVMLFMSQGLMRDDVSSALSRTFEVLPREKLSAPPSEAAYRALFDDLTVISRADAGVLARELGDRDPRFQGAILRSSVEAQRLPSRPDETREWFYEINPIWGETAVWSAIQRQQKRLTAEYLLRAAPWSTQVSSDAFDFSRLFARTVLVGVVVSVLCLILAAPVAHLLNTASVRLKLVMISCALVSLWTSILARTLSWIVIFQREGVFNLFAQASGIVAEPFEILGTRTAVIVGMVHVLLPYMVFSLYDGMRKVPPEQLRAALSLGAAPVKGILLVYVPQLWPAISAGFVIVFTLTVGFYLTPLLLGGPGDQLLAYYIAFFAQHTGNWHIAAALSVWLILLVAAVGLLMLVVARVTGLMMRGARS